MWDIRTTCLAKRWVYVRTVPEKHHPTPEERDERVSLPLPPEVAISAILAAGPHPDDEDDGQEEQPIK